MFTNQEAPLNLNAQSFYWSFINIGITGWILSHEMNSISSPTPQRSRGQDSICGPKPQPSNHMDDLSGMTTHPESSLSHEVRYGQRTTMNNKDTPVAGEISTVLETPSQDKYHILYYITIWLKLCSDITALYAPRAPLQNISPHLLMNLSHFS